MITKLPIQDNMLEYIMKNPAASSKEIHVGISIKVGYATVKRILSKLIDENLIITVGKGRWTKYIISPEYELFYPVDLDDYFLKEIDERVIKETYNFSLMDGVLNNTSLFNADELEELNKLQNQYENNIKELSETHYRKELERLAIDLSWKSSQIEGNTYTLLETERLIKEKETAEGKSKDEAIMLLNHKEAIDFILSDTKYLIPLSLSRIEAIHSILIKDLGVDRNVRTRRVGISGTNYKPIDNEYQIREAMNKMCDLVNNQSNVFEKAFLILLLVSYIQPFNDGNKRTARIISNAMLISNKFCPISFRTVDSIHYKKALLLFYEQNNITAFKEIFIRQFEFAVQTYF